MYVRLGGHTHITVIQDDVKFPNNTLLLSLAENNQEIEDKHTAATVYLEAATPPDRLTQQKKMERNEQRGSAETNNEVLRTPPRPQHYGTAYNSSTTTTATTTTKTNTNTKKQNKTTLLVPSNYIGRERR